MYKLKRSAVCFAAVLGVFWLYKLTLAAWLVPPSVWTRKTQIVISDAEKKEIKDQRYALEPFQEHLFPVGAWERGKPIIVESEDAIFLLRGYKNRQDDEIVQLESCTIIFRPADLTDYKNPNRRVTILQAPDGADLEFEEPIDIGRGKAGRLKSGKFKKQITVRSTPSKPGADDALNVITSDVSIDQAKMTTNSDVHGWLGKNEIFGTGLVAILLPSNGGSGNSRGPSIGGVETVELRQNVRVLIHPTQAGFLPGDRQSNAVNVTPSKPAEPQPPIDIRCQGPFTYSDVEHFVTFTDQVQLRRVYPNNQIDSMDAEWLKIEFARRAKEVAVIADSRDAKNQTRNQAKNANSSAKATRDPAAKNSAKGKKNSDDEKNDEPELGNLEPSKISAKGQPVKIRAPSSGMALDAEDVEYNLFTGRVMTGMDKGRTAVHMRHNEQEYYGYTLTYEPGPKNSLGNLAAQGPGWLRTTMPGGSAIGGTTGTNTSPVPATGAKTEPNIVEVKFQDSLTMQKIKPDSQFFGEHLISIFGDASVNSASTGKIEGDKIYFFVKELPQNIRDPRLQQDQQSFNLSQNQNGRANAASRSMNVIPMRMRVLGEMKLVTFESPQLTGRTKCLDVYFVNAAIENQLLNPNMNPVPQQQNLRIVPFRTSAYGAPQTREVLLTAYQIPVANGYPANANVTQNVQAPYNYAPGTPQNSQTQQVIYAEPTTVAQNPQPSNSARPKTINDVSGHVIRLEILQTEKDQKLKAVTIDTEARFRQVNAANPTVVTTDMAGDHLEVLDAHDPAITTLRITGQPAVIKSPGMEMIGETVRVNYATNKMNVDGAGELNMQQSPAKNPAVVADRANGSEALFGSMGNGPTNVKFPNGLEFDGERITIKGRNNPNVSGTQSRIDVVVTSQSERKFRRKPIQQNSMTLVSNQQPIEETMHETRVLSSPHIEVKLLSRVDFQNMNGSSGMFGQPANADATSGQANGVGMNNLGAQVHTMTCTEGVFLQVREDHANGVPERYSQLHALDLVLDRTTDQVFGNGPGEMVSYSRPTGRRIGLMPAAAAPATVSNGQAASNAADPKSNEIDYMHIDFMRSFQGNTRNLDVTFENNVVVVYGPVKGWSEKLVPNEIEKLTGNGFQLTSDKLIVSQSIGNATQHGTDMDLQAVGNTKIESPTYTANAYRMTYSQAKNEVVLHGGRGDAVLYYYPKQGSDWSMQRAGTFTIWPTTNEVKVDNGRMFEFSQPPSGSKVR